MDTAIPTGAALLLDFIYRTDAGNPPPLCYRTIFGNRQKYLPKPLTAMTLGEVIDAQKNWSNRTWVRTNWDKGAKAASSAAGAAQFMRATLQGLAKELNLSGVMVFDEDFQDFLAFRLLKRRGYDDFVAGKISATEFGKRLAQEWASLPVLAPCQGAHKKLTRGQSYYLGDGLNNVLTTPNQVEKVLMLVRKAPDKPASPPPAPVEAPTPVPPIMEPPPATMEPTPMPAPEASNKHVGIFTALVVLVGAVAAWWHDAAGWLASLWPF